MPTPATAAPSTPTTAAPTAATAPATAAPASDAAKVAASRRRWRGVFAALVLVSGGIVAYASTTGGDDDRTPAAQGAGEVFLEPARSAGREPFSSDTDALVTGVTPVVLPASTTSTTTTAAPTTVPTTTAATTTTAPPVAVASTLGTVPGLYGGTRDLGSCNVDAIATFLAQNADKAAAWAGALGIGTDQIPAYLRTLTPVVLLADTRVTNHGYRDGRATPLQSVLQAGTAVLVDATGVPRVKCACGNPLKEPIARTQTVTYTGTTWSGFDPGRVVVVQPGPTTDHLVIQDVAGGPPISRPVGTSGGSDTTAPSSVAATITRVPVSIPPTTTGKAPATGAATTTSRATAAPTTGPSTTRAATTSSAPTGTVLPSGDFCTRVRGYEAVLDRDFQVDSNWKFLSGRTDAEFGAFLDAALRELAAVAPANVAADVRTVSDWWQPTMTVRDLFGAGVAMPANVQAAIQRMDTTLQACS